MQLHELTFFSALAGRLEAVKPVDLYQCEAGNDPDPETDVVVGDMPPILQAFTYVRTKARVDYGRAKVGIDLIPAAEQEAERRRIAGLQRDAEAMETLFWVALRAQFPELQDKSTISYYRGWKVGYPKDEEADGKSGGFGSRLARALGL